MPTFTLNTDDLQWQEAEGYAAGAMQKVLSDGVDAVPRTILLKLPAGWSMDSHSHLYTEEHFVIEGEYRSLGSSYPRGSYRVVEGRRSHGPHTTKTGAVLLVVFCDVHG